MFSFAKMHGTLNDFVVLDDMNNSFEFSSEQIRNVCDRRAGIGADGLIVVRSSNIADFFMDYSNADGSVAEMCGNGIRCLAKFVADKGLTRSPLISVETRAGLKKVEVFKGSDNLVDSVLVDMGPPIFEPKQIPVALNGANLPIIDYGVAAGGEDFAASFVSMGNPHCVIFVDTDPSTLPQKFGPELEVHSLFPAKTNVEFVRVTSNDHMIMRVWERGSGETFSCGTGACASAVAAILKGLVGERVIVSLLGGDLEIQWKKESSSVFMKGPARKVFEGTYNF